MNRLILATGATAALLMGTSLALADPPEFKVLTLHSWLVQAKVALGSETLAINISSEDRARIQLLPHLAAASGADIVAFQEIWNEDQQDAFLRALVQVRDEKGALVYPYMTRLSDPNPNGFESKDEKFPPPANPHADISTDINKLIAGLMYPSAMGYLKTVSADLLANLENLAARAAPSMVDLKQTRQWMGNGLVIVSKFPLRKGCVDQKMRFTQHTKLDELPLGKGAIATCVEIPNIGKVDLVDSELGGISYSTDTLSYDADQVHTQNGQVDELVDWIFGLRAAVRNPETRPMIGAIVLEKHYFDIRDGLFDYSHFSYPYSAMVTKQGLSFIDTYASANYSSESDAERPGFTDNPESAESAHKQYGRMTDNPPQVSDYIFMSPNKLIEVADSHVVTPSELTADLLKQGKTIASVLPPGMHIKRKLLTHFGVMTTFRRQR